MNYTILDIINMLKTNSITKLSHLTINDIISSYDNHNDYYGPWSLIISFDNFHELLLDIKNYFSDKDILIEIKGDQVLLCKNNYHMPFC